MLRSMSILARSLGACLGLACTTAGVCGQNQPANTAQPNNTVQPTAKRTTTGFDPAPVEFADDPLKIDSVGLSMQVPVNTRTQSTRVGGQRNIQVMAGDGSWIMNIRTPQTSNAATTIKEALDQTIEVVKFSVGVTDRDLDKVVKTEAELMDRVDTLQINGQPAARAYISVPSGEKDKRIVKGYTFFKPSAKQYVLFELIVPGDAYQRVRVIYETMLATAKFADPGMVSAAYATAVKAGVKLFEDVSESDYLSAMGTGEQFHRLYKPASSGAPADAEELGYRSLKFWRGKRGEIDTTRKAADWKGGELDEGYLCQLTVRLLDGKNTIDTVARYFMTPTRQDESWTVVMVKHDPQGREAGRWTETGARSGQEMRVLIVEPGKKNRPVEPFLQGEGYISLFETYLLPTLLVHKAVTEGIEMEFGFYSYRSETENIALRRDAVGKDTASGGAWTINTRYRDDMEPTKSVFNAKGDLIRTELPDGRVWEPIEVNKLMRLWESKKLPTKK